MTSNHQWCRAWLITATLAACWLLMLAVHEAGHVLHAWVSGGVVTRVVLHPLSLSRTGVDPDPHPLFQAAGGPLWGCLLPLAAWGVAAAVRWRYSFLPRFLAGFCLAANGAYLAVDAWTRGGDGRALVTDLTSACVVCGCGIAAVAAGLWTWHAQGRRFGLGHEADPPDSRAAAALSGLVAVIVLVEVLLAG